MAWGFFGGEQRSGNSSDSRFNYGKGINGVDAPPNLWDQSGEAKQNLLAGLQGNRPIISQNDYSGNAQAYGQTGLAAQMQALEMFRNNANGTGGPSLAQQMLAQQSGQIQRGNMAMMQGARGGNIAGAYSQALGANSGQQAGLAQQAAVMRAQEQLAAQQAYAGMANQMAGQGLAYDQLGLQNALGQDQNSLGWYSAKRGLDMQASQNRFNRNMQIGGMVLGGVSALGQLAGGAAMSDVRAKEDLRPISALDAAAEVQPLAYRYKPGMGQPEGQQIGVSAQQLAGTSLGSTLVGQDQNGMLNVDGGRAGIAALAASGENARRLRMLEQQLAGQTSDGGSMAQRYGTREEGMANTRRAQQLSDEIASERGRAQVDRAQYGGQSRFAAAQVPLAMRRGGFERGNINLYNQPEVRNPDGSISTVDSASYNLGGRETLLPSVTPDGRHLQSDEDILAEYRRTGRHLGQFATPDAASSYARELHDAYANGAFRPKSDPFAPNTVGPNTTQGIAGLRSRYFPELAR